MGKHQWVLWRIDMQSSVPTQQEFRALKDLVEVNENVSSLSESHGIWIFSAYVC